MLSKEIKDILRPAKQSIQSLIFRLSLPIKRLRKLPLKEFRFNYFSQNGEDGVVEEIFRRLKINSGWMVEFGAWDGKYASNTFHFLKTHPEMHAVYIEGDKKRYDDLLETTSLMHGQILPINAYITPGGNNSLDNLLGKTLVPVDFDLLSIDVDSIDYQIWEGFRMYTPKVVIIEIHSSIPLGVEYVHDGKTKWHTSFESMRKLGNKKGYSCVHHRGNMFFVRNDLLKNIGMYDLTEQKQNLFFAQKGSIYRNM